MQYSAHKKNRLNEKKELMKSSEKEKNPKKSKKKKLSGLEKLEIETAKIASLPKVITPSLQSSEENQTRGKGQPTLYDESYCNLLEKHMERGYSFESFAGFIGVSISTIEVWARTHKEFLRSKQIAMAKCLHWWEKVAIDNLFCSKDGFNLNANLWRLNMQARFPKRWNPKTNISIDGKIQHDVARVGEMKVEDVIKIGQEALEYLKREQEESGIIDVKPLDEEEL